MIILTIRSDKPAAEIALYDDQLKIDEIIWEAHRTLVETIHIQIRQLLNSHQKVWDNIEGLVVFKGPGSFTGLRIGLTVANTLAYGLNIPIVGSQGNNWQKLGIKQLLAGKNARLVLPEYGAEAFITKPKK